MSAPPGGCSRACRTVADSVAGEMDGILKWVLYALKPPGETRGFCASNGLRKQSPERDNNPAPVGPRRVAIGRFAPGEVSHPGHARAGDTVLPRMPDARMCEVSFRFANACKRIRGAPKGCDGDTPRTPGDFQTARRNPVQTQFRFRTACLPHTHDECERRSDLCPSRDETCEINVRLPSCRRPSRRPGSVRRA